MKNGMIPFSGGNNDSTVAVSNTVYYEYRSMLIAQYSLARVVRV